MPVAQDVQLQAVVFTQKTTGVSSPATMHVFCSSATAPTPWHQAQQPLSSTTFTALPSNEETCVRVPLTTPLALSRACEVLWLEFVTDNTDAVLAFSSLCNGSPVTPDVWVASVNCGGVVTQPLLYPATAVGAAITLEGTSNNIFFLFFINTIQISGPE